MDFKKNVFMRATFVAQFSNIALIFFVAGCSPVSAIPEQRFQTAEELVDVGTAFLKERRLDEAERSFELASELAPSAAAFDGRGCVALVRGDLEEAERFFEQAYWMDAGYDDALINLGLVKELQGEIEDARRNYMTYLEKHPESPTVRNNLAALEYDAGRGTIETARELAKARVLSDDAILNDNLATLGKLRGM